MFAVSGWHSALRGGPVAWPAKGRERNAKR